MCLFQVRQKQPQNKGLRTGSSLGRWVEEIKEEELRRVKTGRMLIKVLSQPPQQDRVGSREGILTPCGKFLTNKAKKHTSGLSHQWSKGTGLFAPYFCGVDLRKYWFLVLLAHHAHTKEMPPMVPGRLPFTQQCM